MKAKLNDLWNAKTYVHINLITVCVPSVKSYAHIPVKYIAFNIYLQKSVKLFLLICHLYCVVGMDNVTDLYWQI